MLIHQFSGGRSEWQRIAGLSRVCYFSEEVKRETSDSMLVLPSFQLLCVFDVSLIHPHPIALFEQYSLDKQGLSIGDFTRFMETEQKVKKPFISREVLTSGIRKSSQKKKHKRLLQHSRGREAQLCLEGW